MRRNPIALALVVFCVLAGAAGCASQSNNVATSPVFSSTVGSASTHTTSPAPRATNSPPAAAQWPTPEDCISYDPAGVTVVYQAGIYSVQDGNHEVMRVSGNPDDTVGQQALALAQQYRKHCFLGRANTRVDKNSYIFDYWGDPSGMTPPIPGQEDNCSSYDRQNLTVEDMGGGDGWRVKDHDHVLHLFDNGSDARNGELVLSKYSQICFIGNGDNDPEIVSYFLA